jgi:hypothetical protein
MVAVLPVGIFLLEKVQYCQIGRLVTDLARDQKAASGSGRNTDGV